eukprot:11971107-Alexandrium_andersonii.AAC.1
MTYTWRSHLRSRSRERAPRCAGASTAPGRPPPGRKRCVPRLWRASGSPAGKPALLASTALSWTSGASRVGATSPSR